MRNVFLCCALTTLACAPLALGARGARAEGKAADKGQTPEKKGEEMAGRAYEAYGKGDFTQAISLYLEAYKITQASEILYNVATIYDKKLKDGDLAIDYYRKYIGASDADPDLVRKATDRINALRAAKESAAAPKPAEGSMTVSKESAPPTPPEDPGKGLRIAGILVAAVGAVGLGVGTAFGLDAKGKNDDAKAMCTGKICSDPRALTLTSAASDNATISTVMFVAGGALLAGGVSLYFLAPKGGGNDKGATTLRLAPMLGAGGGGLHLSGEFL